MTRTDSARWIALLVPAALLAGAYISQYVFHLYPCEMCWWQRYPHFAAVALALLGFARKDWRWPIALAGVAILISGLIGAFHAGVEYKWWEGITSCSTLVDLKASDDPLASILGAPTIRCDEVQWSLFGISLAGFNFLISTAGALLVFARLGKGK